MVRIQKLNFKPQELDNIIQSLEGYIWVAIDIRKCIIAAGDERITDLKWALLQRKCNIYNIFGIGLDLITGEIDFYSPINIKRVDPASTPEVPQQQRSRIEDIIHYFFRELPVFRLPRHAAHRKLPFPSVIM